MKLFFLIFIFLISSPILRAEELTNFKLPIYKTKEHFELSKALEKNDKIIINFWASWCTGCIQELPELEALKQKYNNQKTQFIAINAGESKKKIKKFLKKYKFSYLVLLDKERTLSKSLGVTDLPKTIVIDKTRSILFKGNRPPKEI